MTYPNDHTPEQHRAALGDMLRDIERVRVENPCPECGTPTHEVESAPAEPELGLRAYRGGRYCDHCGWAIECPDTTPDPATTWKYDHKETGDAE